MTQTLIILGCGFLGVRAGSFAAKQGQRVIGTTRDPSRAELLTRHGIEPVVAAEIDPAWFSPHVQRDTHVLVTYPPSDPGDASLASIAASAGARVVYISSTAVYGAVVGRVDQHTPTQPNEPRGQRRLQAEDTWASASTMVLRAPAIYGPGRGLHLRIARGEHQLPDSGDNFISRIHVDDLARLCLAAFQHGVIGTRYVIGDHKPCPQREITQWLCQRMNKPMATATSLANVSPTLRNDRQVDPTWALQQLHVTLEYPTYIEGYEHCLAQDVL
jgi:nucleoside-diphosphate-sugar epimerase